MTSEKVKKKKMEKQEEEKSAGVEWLPVLLSVGNGENRKVVRFVLATGLEVWSDSDDTRSGDSAGTLCLWHQQRHGWCSAAAAAADSAGVIHTEKPRPANTKGKKKQKLTTGSRNLWRLEAQAGRAESGGG